MNSAAEIEINDEAKRHATAGDCSAHETDELSRAMQRIVLAEFAPTSVVVDEDGKVLVGAVNPDFLSLREEASAGNLFDDVIPSIKARLEVSIRETRKTRGSR